MQRGIVRTSEVLEHCKILERIVRADDIAERVVEVDALLTNC